MKIVVLDGYTLNPGDLSWENLGAFGDSTIYDRTPPHKIVERAKEAEILLVNKVTLSRETIDQLPKLKYIGVLATGYNIVDAEAAHDRNIPVTNVPTYGTRSVAQMVFAHLLNLTQRVAHHAQTVQNGKWAQSDDFCYWDYPLIELTGYTTGILGFGRIGRATANLALAFGMNVLISDIAPISTLPEGVRQTDIGTLFRESDVVSLHCPLTPENHHLVNSERIESMRKTAFLINTSRGALIDEQALADALNNDQIAGAGLDVLVNEPPEADNPLFRAKNCFITPHIAWATKSARERLLKTAIENIQAFLNDRPQNVVND
jgi:glycerate dehydrogenase